VPATLPRDLFAERLRAQGVDSRPFFYPLSDMPPYRGARFELSPPIRELAARGITLPSSTLLREEQIVSICAIANQALRG